MALYAVAQRGPDTRRAIQPLIARVARMLRDETLAIDWDCWRAASATSRFHAISLMPFVLLADLEGQALPCPIAQAASAACDERIMDTYLLRSVLGLQADPMPLIARIADIAAALYQGQSLGAPALYDLTHAALYLSLLGAQTPDVPHGIAVDLLRHLPTLMDDRLRLGDFDLAAELLAADIILRGERTAHDDSVCRRLIAAINKDGSVAGPPWMADARHDKFESSYHTTLVVLMALCFAVSSTPPAAAP